MLLILATMLHDIHRYMYHILTAKQANNLPRRWCTENFLCQTVEKFIQANCHWNYDGPGKTMSKMSGMIKILMLLKIGLSSELCHREFAASNIVSQLQNAVGKQIQSCPFFLAIFVFNRWVDAFCCNWVCPFWANICWLQWKAYFKSSKFYYFCLFHWL